MTSPISDLHVLLSTMEPLLNPGTFVYTSVPYDADMGSAHVVAAINEPEGRSLVMSEVEAGSRGLPILFRCAWIALTVNSDLQAVGLTAAFSKALGDAGISCNVVAGAHHDHIFVPVEAAAAALNALRALQASSGARRPERAS